MKALVFAICSVLLFVAGCASTETVKQAQGQGVSLWSWGERIAAFVKRGTGAGTEVEIVSKPVMSPLNFPPDWPQIIFKQVDVELQGGK